VKKIKGIAKTPVNVPSLQAIDHSLVITCRIAEKIMARIMALTIHPSFSDIFVNCNWNYK